MTSRAKKWLLALKIGVALALLAVLGAWAPYFGHELLEMPKDYSYSADVISYDDLYDTQRQQYTGRVQSQTTFSYKTLRIDGPVSIIEALFDVRTQEGVPIFSVKRLYGIDHEDYKHVKGYGDENRQGYLFGPAGYDKANYTYWHVNYDQPLTMVFQDKENILGLETYRYKADFKADQTKNLTNLPEVGKTKGVNLDGEINLWIEPYTGELVKYQDTATAYYYNLATGERISPWNQFSNQYSFDSVAKHAVLAEQRKSRVFLISEVVPAVLMVFIALFTAWCAVDVKKIWQLRAGYGVIAINSAVIMICTIVISAWIIKDSTDLITLFGTTSKTHPSTAASIMLVCLFNMFFALKKTPTRKQAMAIHIVLATIITVSALNVVCNIADANFFLRGGAAPVSAATSFAIILLALLTIISGNNQVSHKHMRAHEVLIIVLIIFGVSSIIADAYGLLAPSKSWYGSVSVSTAILVLLLAASGWDARFLPRKESGFLKNKMLWPLALALLFVFVGASVTGIAWNASKNSVASNATLRFEGDINKIEGLILQRLNSYINALLGARSLFDASEDVTRNEWKAYADGLQMAENYPGDQGIGYAVIVPAAQKQAFEQQVRKEGFPSYSIFPATPLRDPYTAILYLEPFDARNQRAFGYDMFSDPTRRAAMEMARDSGELAMSGKVTLQQESTTDKQAGFLLYLPLYRKGTINNSPLQRRSNIQGYIFSPIRAKNFMQAAIGNQSSGVDVAVYDTGDARQTNSDNLIFVSDPKIDFDKAEFTKTTQIVTGGRTWTIKYANLPGYVSRSSRSTPVYVLISGLSISVLLGVAFFGLANSRQRALSLARKITKDLEKEKDKAIHLQQKDEAILTSIGEGLILYGTQGVIERINAAALRMLGRTENEIVGHKFTDVLKAVDKKKNPIAKEKRPSVLAVRKSTAIGTKLFYVRKDGSSFPAEVTVAPIMAHGKAIGAIEVFRDITEEEALDQAKSDFISLASHQLRAPLTANKWYLELLMSGEVGKLHAKQSEIVRKVDTSNEHLIELVVSLLNVTRIESGRLSINPKPANFRTLIDGVVDTVQAKLKSKKQHISIEVPTLPKVTLDANMIRQVLLNLLTNAIKYSPKNTKITVKAEQKDNHIQCEVRDEGYGIPADQQKNMFEKFFRAKNIAQKEPDGNGLGLYLVKQIVENSGGKIWFTSTQNKGTSFYFTLPLKGVHTQKGEVSLEEHSR